MKQAADNLGSNILETDFFVWSIRQALLLRIGALYVGGEETFSLLESRYDNCNKRFS